MVKILGVSDSAVGQVADALREFEKTHENSECLVYRYNPASIRIKIVDSVFQSRSKGERHDYAVRFLDNLPEDVLSQISVLLCLVSGESSMLDLDFQNPTPSSL